MVHVVGLCNADDVGRGGCTPGQPFLNSFSLFVAARIQLATAAAT